MRVLTALAVSVATLAFSGASASAAGPTAVLPAPAAEAGDGAVVKPRIVGGTDIPMSQAPWQVLLWIGPPNDEDEGWICGGSILTPKRIATAAHCIYDEDRRRYVPASWVDVYAGDADSESEGGQYSSTARIIPHPYYDTKSMAYDAALVELSQPLTYVPGAVQPIALATEDPPVGTLLQASGWGTTAKFKDDERNPGGDSRFLKAVMLPLRPAADCQDDLPLEIILCAGGVNIDTCQGDSGGPLVHNPGPNAVLVGIVSYGYGCGYGPGVYTRVSHPAVHQFLTQASVSVPPVPSTSGDRVAPRVKITKARCSGSRCTVDVTATDPAPSSGIARVEGTVRTRYKARCGGGRSCAKTSTRRMTARRISGSKYRLTVKNLRRGTHEIRVTATDKAGNRSKVASVIRKVR